MSFALFQTRKTRFISATVSVSFPFRISLFLLIKEECRLNPDTQPASLALCLSAFLRTQRNALPKVSSHFKARQVITSPIAKKASPGTPENCDSLHKVPFEISEIPALFINNYAAMLQYLNST